MKDITQLTEGLNKEEKAKFYELKENFRLLWLYWTLSSLVVMVIIILILGAPLKSIVIEPMMDGCNSDFCEITLTVLIIFALIIFSSIVGKLLCLKKTKYYLDQVNKIISTKEGKKALNVFKKHKSQWYGIYNRARKRKFYHWLFVI